MKYPKIKCALNKKNKICKEDIPNIKKLRTQGWQFNNIANLYGVSRHTIYYIFNPKQYQKDSKKRRKYFIDKYNNDKKFKENQIKQCNENNQKRYNEDSEYRKYCKSLYKKWYKENKDHHKAKRRERWRLTGT